MLRASCCLSLVILATLTGAAERPTGRLAYLKDGAAWVQALGSRTVRLPASEGAVWVSMSPTDGTCLYTQPAAEDTMTVVVSRPPYAVAKPLLPAKGSYGQPVWTANGLRAYLAAGDAALAYEPALDQAILVAAAPLTLSADGEQAAWRTDKAIRLRNTGTGAERDLFGIGRPEALFASLRSARYPKRLADLTKSIDADLWHDASNWQLTSPALMPDGKRLFFATNAGTSAGAAGNCTWCLFAADTADGKLAPLSGVGAQYGRVPHWLAVSPDSRYLAYLDSYHDSALSNPCGLHLTDLLTQADRELLWAGHDTEKEACVSDEACWSPDSRFVAVSVAWYEPRKLIEAEATEIPAGLFNLLVYDVATGRAVLTVPGGRQPSWGK
ncbi:MAG: PD40 domain-containing protein [Armatimonadetes bacterium]|nr:PD40 domain-containing protein [Armatimonadota bacterium]